MDQGRLVEAGTPLPLRTSRIYALVLIPWFALLVLASYAVVLFELPSMEQTFRHEKGQQA